LLTFPQEILDFEADEWIAEKYISKNIVISEIVATH